MVALASCHCARMSASIPELPRLDLLTDDETEQYDLNFTPEALEPKFPQL